MLMVAAGVWVRSQAAVPALQDPDTIAVKTCGTCRFFDQSACRRYPPTRVYTGDTAKNPEAVDMIVWVLVKPENWCGEHQRKL